MGFVLAASSVPPTWFVIALGVAVVFVGLICIVGIIKIMNLLTSGTVKVQMASSEVAPATPAPAAPAQAPVATPVAAPIENRGEIIAAVCAAVAEENGTDVSAIRVISFKKL